MVANRAIALAKVVGFETFIQPPAVDLPADFVQPRIRGLGQALDGRGDGAVTSRMVVVNLLLRDQRLLVDLVQRPASRFSAHPGAAGSSFSCESWRTISRCAVSPVVCSGLQGFSAAHACARPHRFDWR